MTGLRRAPHRRLLRSLRRRQLFLESLEDRRLLSVFTVNSTDDEPDWLPGDGQALTAKKTTTLRAAIMEANASPGKDTIEFNIPGAGPHVIQLATRLPAIIDPITIDGYSQPGARPNSKTLRDGHDAVVKIELDGSLLPIGTNGLDIVGGQSEVLGLAIHSFYGRPISHQEYLGTTIVGEGGMGIWLWSGRSSQIVGNFLGATAAGQLPAYPRPADAISTGVVVGSADNVIQENLVVGHSGAGIALGSRIATELAENVRGNRVVGNYIGLLQDGQTARGNSTGILVCWGAFGNYIGGDEARRGNLVSGNTGVGISIVGVAPENKYVGGNIVQRNLIGTDRTGTSIDRDGKANSGDETGNRHAGIQIDRSPGNVVGGAFVSAGNVISGNLAGVTIFEPPSSGNQIEHNKVGTDLTGSTALPNTLNGIQIQRSSQNEIVGNVIAGNLGTGVYVEGPAASGNKIQDNLIGVDSTGSTGLGNGNGGIDILHASSNTIQRNTISGSPNFGIGVTILGVTATTNVVTKNRIGTDAAGLRAVGNTGMGVAIVDASENTLSDNVISGNEMDGVLIRGVTARHNIVTGNLIGLNADGNAALLNQGAGVYIDGAPENGIGGDMPESGNVISGNAQEGIKIVGPMARKNRVLNNYIGTDHDGHGAGLGNALGVLIENAAENLVGALVLGHNMGNVIAGNFGDGIVIRNQQKVLFPEAVDNKVQANWIGVDADQAPLPNRGAGVRIVNAAGTIVGSEPIAATGTIRDDNAGNIIAHNRRDGVRVEGPYAHRNTLRGNTIFDNEQLGINLVGGREVVRKPIDGVTPNDDDDSDDGPNRLMNFPVGVTAYYEPRNNTTYISGVLAAEHPDQAMVDLYANAGRDASGFGEGQFYIDSATPNTSGVFHLTYAGPLPHPFLSATATDGGGRGSTSEFSPVCDVDTDGDGLPDDWESKGIDFNGDGRIDLDLPALGARPDHKDLFVEFDYLEGFAPGDSSITQVQSAFHHAPVPNPDGTPGIALHVNRVADADRIPFVVGQTEQTHLAQSGPGASDDWWDLKQQYFGTAAERAQADQWPSIRGARSLVFRYSLFLRDQFENPGSSGLGDLHGDGFVVSIGTWSAADINHNGGRTAVEAGTFMHELGHTLGLHHGGPVPTGYVRDIPYGDTETNYKPNYLSIMSYSFQDMRYTVRPLDYSTVQLPALDESKLLERDGINGQRWYPQLDRWTHTVYTDTWTGTSWFHKVPSQQGIDWNRSLGPLDTGHVGGYINDPSASAARQDTLDSHQDWPWLRYSFRYSKTGFQGLAGAADIAARPPELFHAEPTDQEIFDTLLRVDSDEDGVVNAYDNLPHIPNLDQTDSDGNGIGDAGELLSVVLDRNSVTGGENVTGTVTALYPAPAGGLRVFLWTSDAETVEAPESVTIPAGQRSATFAVQTSQLVSTGTPVDLYAHYWGDALRTDLLVGPRSPQADLSLALAAAPEPVGLGGIVTYTVDVTNHGPQSVTGVTLTDVLPDRAVLKSASGRVTSQVPGPGLHVRFDYTYDTSHFFDTQEKKNLLQLAGDLLMSALGDDLAAIVPDGGNTWTAIFENPATGAEERIDDLVVPANELIVFIGARDLGDTGTGVQEGALAGPGGLFASGSADFNRMVTTRGERGAEGSMPTDFGPWGGTITFNTNPAVAFSYDGAPEPDEFDFLTVALHEMMHVLGLGASASWQTYVDAVRGVFTGPAARLEYDAGGDVPLDPGSLAHWREGLTEAGEPVLMDPLVPNALRIWYPTALDWAGLADVGWNIDGLLTVERPVTFTEVAGSVIGDIGVLAPGQSVEITLEVQPTLGGTIHNVATVTGYCDDPHHGNNTAETFGTVTPLVLIVNSTDDVDDGVVDATHTSLREALNAANNAPGVNTISFHIPGRGPHTIQPTSPLPVITDPVIIDGTTEPDYAGTPVIELNGVLAGLRGNGLTITAGGSIVRALVIHGFQSDGSLETGNAILLKTGDGNTIEGCYLGTDVSGVLAVGNEGAGVLLLDSDTNTIGGTKPLTGNVISGNTEWGIFLGPGVVGNEIEGNLIGTDATGTTALGNGQAGIELHRATSNLIGGRTPEARNVISGNSVGIAVRNFTGLGGTSNRIEGNLIGTNATGDAALGNGMGILIHEFLTTLAGRDTIGGTAAGAGNVISGNVGTGIQVIGTASIHVPDETYPICGNLIGVAADAVTPLGNGGDGILVMTGTSTGVFGGGANIGGPQAGAGNVIAHNGGHGVHLSEVLFPRVRGNSIYANGGLGIEYVFSTPPPGSLTAPLPPGVNPQRPGIDHTIVDFPNAPVLSRAYSGAGTTTIEGTLASYEVPDNVFIVNPLHWTLDFYASPEADPSEFGEGQIYLGSLDDVYAMGTRTFSAIFPAEVPAGYVVTATATGSFYDNTSEFSNSVAVAADTDGDGVLDVVEDAGPNGGDANNDGTLDHLQNRFASLPNAVDGQYVILEVQSGGTLRDVRAMDNPSSYDMPPSVSFPLGFFSLTTAAETVTLYPPGSHSLGTAYNYGSTADRPFDHWYQVPAGGVSIDPDKIVLHVHPANTAIGLAEILAGAGTTIVVNSTDDADDGLPDNGHTTLREAINRSNFLPGRDTVVFDVPGPGPHTIRPTSSPNPLNPGLTRVSLPQITDPIVIDGYTQPGALPASDTTPATLMIELDGSLAGRADGLWILAGHSIVRGLVINRFGTDEWGWRGGAQISVRQEYGGAIEGHNIIEGNYIGTDVTGTTTHHAVDGYWSAQRYGIVIGYSSHNTVGGTTPATRNVIAGMSGTGIEVYANWYGTLGATGNRVLGNYIGTDATGLQALGNLTGVRVDHASQTSIGSLETGAGNVISGNEYGIHLNHWAFDSPGTIVQGNFIGVDATGTAALGNAYGGISLGGWNCLIGGDVPQARNVISANEGNAISITGSGDAPLPQPAGRHIIQGNYIGTDVTGSLDLGNAGHGISIEASKEILIGGSVPGAGNVIAYNHGSGIVVAGWPHELSYASANRIWMNSVFANGGLGIDLVRSDTFSLEPDGVTPNDPADGFFVEPQLVEAWVDFDGSISWVHVTVSGPPNWLVGVTMYFTTLPDPYYSQVVTDDSGYGELVQGFGGTGVPAQLDHVDVYDLGWFAMANMLQNYPEITSVALGADTTIEGTLDSTPETAFRLEFFDNGQADDSGYGEGQAFLGALDVTTDATGMAPFSLTLPQLLPLDHFVTATATDPDGNTSEFSLAVAPTAAAWDFGDAPDPAFPTLLASNGARHALGSQLHLGAGVDAEEDGQPTESADGDNTADLADEDGVGFLSPLVPGQWAAINVTASAQGRLDAWIDFAGDGSWADAEDLVFRRAMLLPGRNTLLFEVPTSASISALACARFRFSSAGGLHFDGPAVDGEVEDYLVAIAAPATDNLPPTAVDDQATTHLGVPIAIDVTPNDFDPEGRLDPHSVTVTALPTSGRVFVDPASGVITYIPSAGFAGDDEFSYRVRDLEGLVDTARVLVHVLPGNRPPLAEDDSATTDEDVPVAIDVLANDTDPDGGIDPTTVTIVAPPAHGSVQVDAQSGAVTYTPRAHYSGTDRFVYAVSDIQGATARAAVDVRVQPVSDPPVAHDDLADTDQDLAVVIDVLANDADADGDLDVRSVSVVEPPLHGATEVDPDTGAIAYSPAAGFRGLDTCVYEVRDAAGQAATATVRIEVRPTSNPPRATADSAETPEDTPVTIDVPANDTDPDGDLDPGSVRLLVRPLHGSAVVVPETGQVVYTPLGDFAGHEWLWYEIRDARGSADIGLVHITVTPVNDPPVAGDDTAVIQQDTATILYVLSNDTDVDSWLDPASLRIEIGPSSGTVTRQADGSVRYTPRTGFTGTDSFRYTIADDAGARSNVATVTLRVQAEPTMLVVGRVFEDLDGTGPGLHGPGRAGVPVYLLDGQGHVLATTITQPDDPVTPEDEQGWYHFPDLHAGTYILAQKRVAGWSQSYPDPADITLDEPPVEPGLYVVTLLPVAEPEVLDFGNYRTGEAGYASVAGRVYVDVNNDGRCDPQEMGLPNVPITISGPVTRVTYTLDDGSYRFEDLPPGSYTIVETQPLLFQDGRDTPGTPRLGTCDNDRFQDLELMPDMALTDYNFGEYGLKSQFISKQLLLASTPPSSVFLGQLQVASGESLLLLEVPADGTLRAATTSEGEPPAVQLYDEHWRPVALSAPGGTLRTPVTAGQHLLVYVRAEEAATVCVALEATPPPSPVYMHTNRAPIHDVNGDGWVSPRDALLVINSLNATGTRGLPDINLGAYYLDVNADRYLSPRDALLIINTLNQITDIGEGEQTAAVRDRALWEFLAETEKAAADELDALLDTLGCDERQGSF